MQEETLVKFNKPDLKLNAWEITGHRGLSFLAEWS